MIAGGRTRFDRWFDEADTAGNGTPDGKGAPYVVAASRAGLDPPVRPWLVEDWIPRRQVTLIGGIGGSGKTLLALQLMIGAAHTGAWLGLPVMRCKSFGLFAEDEDDELDLRLRDNADLALLTDLAWRSGVGQECELVEPGPDGALKSTPAFDQLRQDVLGFAARLVVLDAAADLFGGDEIRRRQVAFFIRLLRRLAIEIDGAVILLAHPSNHGIANNTGLSGSTGWGNSSRSVLVFGKSTDDGADDDERVLRREKANYAKRGEIIRMRWTRGSFTPIDPPGSLDSILMGAKADRVFLDLLAQTYQVGNWISPNSTARNYAPNILAKHPDREGLGKPAFEAAMVRLQRAGRIKTETYGKSSNQHYRLVMT